MQRVRLLQARRLCWKQAGCQTWPRWPPCHLLQQRQLRHSLLRGQLLLWLLKAVQRQQRPAGAGGAADGLPQ